MTGRYVDVSSLRVISRDVGVSAVFVPAKGALIVSPHQSFEAAVDAVHAVVPGAHPDRVREVVRRVLKGAASASLMQMPGPPVRETTPRRRPRLRQVVFAAIGVLVLLASAVAAGMMVGRASSDGIRDPFSRSPFPELAEARFMGCEQLERSAAVCTVDGSVYYVSAWLGPHDVVSYTFMAEEHRMGMRVFPDVSTATVWTDMQVTKDDFDGLTRLGPVVLWGNDTALIDKTATVLRQEGLTNSGAVSS